MSNNLHAMPVQALNNPLLFSNHEIRPAVDENNNVWFCAKDVFESINVEWKGSGTSLRNMPENWVCTLQLRGERGVRDVVFMSEPAVYRVLFRSKKPEAVDFANWVCEEVLPSIRKKGFWGKVDQKNLLNYYKQIEMISTKLAQTGDAFLYKLYKTQLIHLCNLVGQKIPDFNLLGKDHNQLEMEL